MRKKFAVLQNIENDHKITKETDDLFLYHLQNSLLLALKEQNLLNSMQCKLAQDKLFQQHHKKAGNQPHTGESKN